MDIRIAPGSKRNPQFARTALEDWLPEAGIAYRWDKRLGGFRKPGPGNPDVAWHQDMYRGYAEHMRTDDFGAAVGRILDEVANTDQNVAVMCSESQWRHCHRRLLADFVSRARDEEIRHLLHDGRLEPHVPSAGLRLRDDGLIIYDGGQATLL